MALIDKLNDSQTKEAGGRHGGKGHEFQRYWALCHLLQIDSQKDSYLLLMEFIEDVAVLNGEETPDRIELFQIKKKEGTSAKWTKATLAKAPKDGQSILAKLHESKSAYKDETDFIAFVSNAPIDFKMDDGAGSLELAEFNFDQLDKSLISELESSIAKEVGCQNKEIDLSNLRFLKSPLAMGDLERHAIGRVSSFLAEKFPDHSSRADVLCKALYSEISVKAVTTDKAADFSTLKKSRGISKSKFSEMLKATLLRKSDSDVIDEFLADLSKENVPFVQRQAIKNASRRFLVDKAGPGNGVLSQLHGKVEIVIQSIPNNLVTSWDVANWIIDQIVGSDVSKEFAVFEREYLIAATLYWVNKQ